MNAAPSTVYVNRFVNKANVPVWLGTDGNYADTEWNTPLGTAGTFSLVRLANSINCTQRLQGTTAWLTAASGNDFNTGQMVVNSISTEEAIGFTLSSAGNLLWFVDGVRYTGTTYSFSRLYPSRLLVSYRNKPEVFDAPTVALDVDSDSVIDVNTSDGQYITGVIPFFGEAAFTASQKAAILAVFKQNSIYLVDLVAKANGLNPVQKIDSQGIGCTAPYSLANTKDGVVFANEGGIYRLNHDLTVEFLGQLIERLYGQNVNVDRLEIAQGHNHAVERRYQLSVPFAESEVNTDVLVYDHSREQSRYDQKPGSWTRFDNFPVTGWTNLGIDSYFASSRGKVFKLRNTGDTSDYRDDEDPILMRIDLRAMDFGDAGVRKTFPHVLLRFRGGSDNLGTIVSTASDLSSAFAACDQFKTDLKDRPDGLSDLLARQLYTIRFSVRDNRGMFLQVRVENGSKDETCELTQLAVKVAGLKAQGTTEAQTTTKSNGNK
jgi:hypothetical protein